MAKKLKIQMNGRSDQFQTPPEALNVLIPFLRLNKFKRIWECAWGKGNLARDLRRNGFDVKGNSKWNFLERADMDYDCIVTNPPYSIKDKFLEKCYKLNLPFALLMPLTALEGKKRGGFYRKHGIQLIIPNKRINFITPSGKGSGAWFQVAWYCWKLNLPKDLMFVELY